MKNHQTNGEDWKPTKDWIFVHRQLEKFLSCIDEMKIEDYEELIKKMGESVKSNRQSK